MNALAGHMLGDWLLQNRWLARMKRAHWWGMVLHCAIVTVAVAAFTGWWDIRGALVFVSHFLVDWLGLGKDWWPRLLDQGNPDNSEPAPAWLGLMMDQALHIVSLALIARIA